MEAARAPGGVVWVLSPFWKLSGKLAQALRLLPSRLRDRRFWITQALVWGVTATHYTVEVSGFTGPYGGFHDIPVILYIIPVIYASLHFGFEGGVLTGFACLLLSVPNMVFWHQHEYEWVGELAMLAVIIIAGDFLGGRAEEELQQRWKAEKTSARLALLNEVGADLGRSLDVEGALSNVPGRLVDGLGLETAWICLRDERGNERQRLFQQPRASPEASELPKRLDDAVLAAGQPVWVENRALALPLTAEGGVLGSLGVATGGTRAVATDEVELLTTVAHQIGVAVDNARLYRQRQESLQSYARQVTQVQEEERKRIARELHDDTAQALVALCRGLDSLSDSNRRLPKAAIGRLAELRGLAEDALENVRRFSRDLRPSVLDDLGLIPAIEWLVADLTKRQPIDVRPRVEGKQRRLSPNAELALFRVVQEALRNVEKHAQASEATVEVSFEPRTVRVTVEDNGRGFRVPPRMQDLAHLGRLGLLGMKERVELLGGTLAIDSQPGKGTRITACLSG